MNYTLKPYQQEAVDQLSAAIVSLIEHEGRGEICVFQSPTGSGKTLMMAKTIEDTIRQLVDDDICFLWMTIGKGDLDLQSKHSLEQYFNGAPRVTLVAEDFSGGRDRIAKNEVVVANWEKLRSKDRASGDWKNILMKDGENINFREVLEKTRSKRKLILIIDESHFGADAERTTELRQIIDADVVVEMSATPKLLPTAADVARHRASMVLVEPERVIEEGMIKKEIIINEGIAEIAKREQDSQEVVLEAAYRKRLAIKKAYADMGVEINPLVIVQIPTAEAGDDKMKAVKTFLEHKGITEKNRKLAIWLSERKSEDIDAISEPDNEAEFLIFKQAIDTGWDCPRAHILLKFRETHSATFEIQTVGRILRMPEQKHYADEILNTGYVFTNIESIHVKREEYNPNIINRLPAKRVPTYKPIKLTSYYKSRADYGDIRASFTPVFFGVAKQFFNLTGAMATQNRTAVEKKGILLDLKKFEQEIIANTRVAAKSFDDLEGTIKPEDRAKLSIAGNDLQALFEEVIRRNLGSFTNVKRSVPVVKSTIYQWFHSFLGSGQWREETLMVQKIVVHEKNRERFEQLLSQAVQEYKKVKEAEVQQKVAESEQWTPFELPISQYFNEHLDEEFEAKKYAYVPCYLSVERSEPEKAFEAWLNSKSSNIMWWWKNGESKQEYFGVKYESNGEPATFYPDYLVQFKDGRIGILEVKDEGDQDGATKTKAKAEALQAFIPTMKRKDIFGGIVIRSGRVWRIHQGKKYNWEKTLKDDWSEWETLE
jgi:type III restriction enzyme